MKADAGSRPNRTRREENDADASTRELQIYSRTTMWNESQKVSPLFYTMEQVRILQVRIVQQVRILRIGLLLMIMPNLFIFA